MKITLTVCNVCGDKDAPTREYEIRREDGRKARVDLCAAHGQPFDAFLQDAPARPSTARQRPQRAAKKATKKAAPARSARVMTIEEIEAGKKAGTL